MASATHAPDGFHEAFDPLFARAYRVARRIIVDPASAEDVAAETMARAYAHWGKIGKQPWREGWIVRVASNLSLDLVRRRSRMANEAPAERAIEDDDVAIRLALAEALALLPRRQREVVVMRHLAGLSEAEVADALRVSTGSVKTHLHRGVASLRDRLGPILHMEEVRANA